MSDILALAEDLVGESKSIIPQKELYKLKERQEFYSWAAADTFSTLFMQDLFAYKHPNESNPITSIHQPKDLAELQIAQFNLITRLKQVLKCEKVEPVLELDPKTGEKTGNYGFVVTNKQPPQT